MSTADISIIVNGVVYLAAMHYGVKALRVLLPQLRITQPKAQAPAVPVAADLPGDVVQHPAARAS